MAKLKIFEGNDPTAAIPSKDGYRNVTKYLLADLATFLNASDKERSDLLQQYSSYGGSNHIIYQLTKNPEANQAIDCSNCKVNVQEDERKKPSANFGKHNMVLPDQHVGDPPINPGYLEEYIKAIVSLYGDGTPTKTLSACEFLFGIMLLTRCR
ncbi:MULTISPECIES: hypothetical protein [unclassified Mesorhizobium]|uniref:hypothetical protein n=1 Tax=unclassified Mesorhizobium TaxID=325217 RepID=UPI0003CFCC98|nr:MULTISPECIES: hypothetical protein [unclassified Mesorhizobium]ESZ05407.1 hypothetical protein X736_19790 [Mesorhizobium sp. L2C089B000]WJI49311.1 hypothetical protein NLY44_22040 [Mesorhizobium sp. C089B]